MAIYETHCHSVYSGDVDKTKGSSIDGLCARAVELGLDSLAITDHLEFDQMMGNIFPPLDFEGILRDVNAAKVKYAGKLDVVYGVEMAQAIRDMRKAKEVLGKYRYDFIIGSVHCVKGFPDFSDMDYGAVSDSMLAHAWELYISEMTELAKWGGFDTLAHVTYPYRYFHRHGREGIIDVFNRGREYFEPIFRTIIEKGIALEVNTSGIRQGDGTTFPHTDLIKFYKELGGEMLTVGSDAHYACDVAKDIAETYELLKSLGFGYVCTYSERKPVIHTI